MDFLTFLGDYEQEDVSAIKSIVETNKSKEDAVMKEAFNSDFPSKKEALFNLENYFVEDSKSPKTVDSSFVRDNYEDLKAKIEKLDEGDIRIIIHNHENKGDEGGQQGFAGEEATPKPKKKRGRPAKVAGPAGVVLGDPVVDDGDDAIVTDVHSVPEVTPLGDIGGDVLGDEDEDLTDADSERERWADEVPKVLGDEDVDVADDDSIVDEIKPDKVRWSDIVNKVLGDNPESKTKDELVEELSGLPLDDNDLKTATDMAESGEIVEDDSPISQAATLIRQINSK